MEALHFSKLQDRALERSTFSERFCSVLLLLLLLLTGNSRVFSKLQQTVISPIQHDPSDHRTDLLCVCVSSIWQLRTKLSLARAGREEREGAGRRVNYLVDP